MERQNILEMVAALYGSGDSKARLDILSRVVIDLLVEVEALRGALVRATPGAQGDRIHGGYDIPFRDRELTGGKGVYSKAYVDAAYVSHNAAGPSSGVEKLLARFYPAGGVGPREALMLRRLGFNDAEIARFMEAADHAEQFT